MDNLYEMLLDTSRESGGEPEFFPGLLLGKVKKNWDQNHKGMVKVELLGGEQGKTTTEWIPIMNAYAGKNYGACFLPEIGDVVVVGFLMGNLDTPVVLGSMWDKNNPMPGEAADSKNQIKAILTKGGHKLILDETKNKESIKLITKGKNTISLEDKENTITIKDEKGGTQILIQGKKEEITIKGKKKITLAAGSAKLVLDGSSNKITIESGSVEVQGKQGMKLKSQSTKLEGSMVEIKGQSTLKVNSSGMLELKGAMTKIN